MPGSNQGQGPNGQGSALGMNSLHVGPVGSPTMNRMEGGGEQGVERNTGAAGNSPTGTAMQGNTQAAVGNWDSSDTSGSGLSWSSWKLSWNWTDATSCNGILLGHMDRCVVV